MSFDPVEICAVLTEGSDAMPLRSGAKRRLGAYQNPRLR